MAGKPELSAAPGVQNVVVYVSNDNFAQAYAVGQQNVAANSHQIQGAGYGNPPHSMATVVAPPKSYPDKQTLLKAPEYSPGEPHLHQGGYFGVIQNGFPQPVYHHHNGGGAAPATAVVKSFGGGGGDGGNADVLSGERQAGPGRPEIGAKTRDECDSNNTNGGGSHHEAAFVDVSGYVTVMGAEGPAHSVRCDSVRSETAESSCSSLSSADEGMVVVHHHQHHPHHPPHHQPPPDMVVYDSSVSVRPGGVVLAVGPTAAPLPSIGTIPNNNNQQPSISVPYGWKRLVNNGSVIYISPSNTALNSPEQVKEYLLTAGTCKCGLECHFKYDNVFNFDPKVVGKQWTLSPDTNTGDLTKLCNHKRKIIAMASLDCKPPDPGVKVRKEYNTKKTKRKIGVPYGGCVSVSQILAQREKMAFGQQPPPQFSKEGLGPQPQMWSSGPQVAHRLQGYPDVQPQSSSPHLIRYQDQQQQPSLSSGGRLLSGSPLVLGDAMMVQQPPQAPPTNISQQQQVHQQNHQLSSSNVPQSSNIHVHHQHIIGPNGQVISVQRPLPPPPNNHQAQPQQMGQLVDASSMMIQQQQQVQPGQNHQQHRVFINSQPNEPSGPGRPNIQMIPVGVTNQRPDRLHPIYPPPPQYQQIQQYEGPKQIRPAFVTGNGQIINGFRPQPPNQMLQGGHILLNNNQQQPAKIQWTSNNNGREQIQPQVSMAFERVPPLHQHTPAPAPWQEDVKRKKVKLGKLMKRPYHLECQPVGQHPPPCPNIDVRQIPNENGRSVIISHLPQNSQSASSPSFMEDPSGYLAQQTALLNSTINRQTGANGCPGMICSSPVTPVVSNSHSNEVPLPSNVVISHLKQNRTNQSFNNILKTTTVPPQHQQQHHNNIITQQQYNQMMAHGQADSSVINDHPGQCHGCNKEPMKMSHSRPNSQPGTPSSSGTIDDPVTSSNYSEKQQSPDSRPIQGGTVSTSNVSPMDGSHSGPPTPTSHPPSTPPQQHRTEVQVNCNNIAFVYNNQNQQVNQSREICSSNNYNNQKEVCCSVAAGHLKLGGPYTSGIVTTMASGRTVGSNTITSVLAGRANTATVSINNPLVVPNSTNNVAGGHGATSITMNVSKSPLEMVQSVVSSIQMPQNQNVAHSKQSPTTTGLPPGHILVSSGGQLIMANTVNSQSGVMPPPPPKIVSNQQGGMPPISVSPMITNVTGAVSQVIPAVAQQVLGQQTVLVNALPAPFVLQMDGMVGQNVQLPQLVAGNVIQQHQIQIDNSDQRRNSAGLMSPETGGGGKKKGKKRKMSSQTVASMLHIAAAQQNSGVVMSQQGFPQQIQMAHSPQGLTAGPVMQALTIVPSKTGGPPQLVMNGPSTSPIGTQQLITNSQPTQQINLLQPVNLINGTVQNFPTIQQFIVPNLGGMVMNPDGTATILQDTSNLGMQLQLQNVNGQNVLTPVQNNGMFNGGQSILAASPAGMVIRTPTSQGKIIQQQQHSPGAQFLSPNGGQFVVNGAQFGGQLSPLVASVSPSQSVTFGTAHHGHHQPIRPNNQQPQEFIQCGQMGQTLMVPCAPATNMAVSSANQQNTTFVQQNTTIVQQQTTMVSNNQGFQANNSQPNVAAARATLNVDQNFIISSNDGTNKQVQALLVQRENPHNSYRHSVSTQTAVNQNSQSVTTNTFCQTSTLSAAGSPPDTTTHSPLASSSGGQSPPTADTTTHSGSTDDGLSPAPSNCSANNCDSAVGRQPTSCTMAMVHCISSSEPDSADLNTQGSEQDWSRSLSGGHQKSENDGFHFVKKSNTPTHIAYAESSTMVQFLSDHNNKSQEDVVSSHHNFDKLPQKRKNSDALLVMEAHHMHSSLFDGDEDDEIKAARTVDGEEHYFAVGDLVWGPAKASAAWPGKIIQVEGCSVTVRWFGNEKTCSKLDMTLLRTLTEGLDAHHQARKKSRTSRKLSAQLENAIQEAMAELDKDLEENGSTNNNNNTNNVNNNKKPSKGNQNKSKVPKKVRFRSGQ